MIGSLGRIAQGIGGVASTFFGGGRQPAVEAPQITNIQTVGETQESGTENMQAYNQANPFALFTPQVAQGIARNLPSIGRALGIGGGAVLGSQLLGGSGEVCQPKEMAPYSVNKQSGCVTVTRKQQAKLKEMVGIIGLEATADAVGLDPNTLVLLLLKKFKARGRGITASSMRTTKRTIRQIKNLHAEVSSMAGRRTTVRRGSTTKTSIVKA